MNESGLEEFKNAIDGSFDVKVPAERRVSISSAIGIALAAIFFMLFLIAVSQFYGYLISYFMTAFMIFGWDPILTSLFMALFFLFLGVTIYLMSKRGNEAVTKIEAGLRIMFDNPPTRFYDLSDVPSENIVRELVGSGSRGSKDKGRGCTLVPKEGNGFDIHCDTIPDTRAMRLLKEGKLDAVEMKQKLIIGGVFAVMGVLLGIVTVAGMLIGIAMWILWIVYLVAFFYIMIELRVLVAWSAVIAWAGFNVFFTFFIPDPYFLWSLWGAWICGFILVAILYVVSKDACVRKKAWYCEFM